jgi:tight adherence protein B
VPELPANIDPNLVYIVAGGFAVVLLLLLTGIGLAVATRPRARLRHRMVGLGLAPAIERSARTVGSGARQRRVQERLQELQAKGKDRSRRNAIKSMIVQAGLDMNMRSFVLVSVAVGLAGAVVYLLGGYPPIGAPAAAIFAGVMLPRWVLRFLAKRRQKKFTANFANAIDVLVRGIRTGLPVGECLAIVGRESPEPVATEFRLMVEGQKLGLSLEELLRRGLERLPTAEYKFFAIVLQIQQQTGGNLAETLENLSRVLRERKKLRDKVKALSAEAKASAMIIGALPFFVAGAITVVAPNYLAPLFDEGIKALIGAGIWMLLGMGVMTKMINFKI